MINVIKRHMLAPWFAGYGLVGMVVSGIVPILIPLSVAPRGPFVVGLVVAAFYLGTLCAPLFGAAADRRNTQRLTFLVSFPVMAASALTFGVADNVVVWFISMLVAGAAAGAAQTTASMFIVEGQPKNEWDERIGWLRVAFGVGQVTGLAVSTLFAHRVDAGWFVAAALVLVGTALGRIGLPRIATRDTPVCTVPTTPPERRRDELMSMVRSEFGTFLACWLFAMIGLMTFYNVVPLVLREAFAIDPSVSSMVFLGGSAVGAALYPVCGWLCVRVGAAWVLAFGVLTTLIAFTLMSVATVTSSGVTGKIIAGACLVVIASVYPFQYLGATVLAAELTTGGEGSAMGLFNSGVAAGACVGAVVPAFLARAAGYDSLPWFSTGALIIAVLFGIPILRRHARDAATGAHSSRHAS